MTLLTQEIDWKKNLIENLFIFRRKKMLKKKSRNKMLKKNLRKNRNFRFSKNQDFRIFIFQIFDFVFEILKFLKFQNFQNQKSPRLKNNFRSDFFYS